jgi:hypothetical protein
MSIKIVYVWHASHSTGRSEALLDISFHNEVKVCSHVVVTRYLFRGGENRLCRFGGALVGQWKDGDMLRAYYVEASPESVGETGAHLSHAEVREPVTCPHLSA